MAGIGDVLRHVLGRGVFPAQLAWFLEAPWRRLVLSPATLRGRLPLAANSTVCELGVGGGYYGRALAPAVGHFIGLDLQRAMLERIRRSGDRRLLLIQADGMAWPLAAASVDLVVAVTVLGEIPSPARALGEVARVLRPGGTLSVSEHIPDPDYVPFGRLTQLCRDCGLDLVGRHGPAWSYTANFRKPARPGNAETGLASET